MDEEEGSDRVDPNEAVGTRRQTAASREAGTLQKEYIGGAAAVIRGGTLHPGPGGEVECGFWWERFAGRCD
jgi:hypothetical protein